jgi:AcrR family transcriptional regulator
MKSDRRVRYTRMVLKQALLSLMLERPITRITVTEICERAEVNRATFYAHYADPYDLLARIENELFESIRRSIAGGLSSGSLRRILTDICSFIRENGALCRVIFSEYGDREFLERVLNIARVESVALWRSIVPHAGERELERMYAFFSQGSAAVIRGWVLSGMQDAPEEIAAFLERISMGGLAQIAGNPEKSAEFLVK